MENIAFALNEENKLSETLGTAKCFLIFSGQNRKIVSAKGMIPEILQKNKVGILFCGKIGMCLLSLLEGNGIEVHPGYSGMPETLLENWKAEKLSPASNYLCSENGRSCGSCPGRF